MSVNFFRRILTSLIFVVFFGINLAGSVSVSASQQGWRLVWSDEFNGSGAPDSAKWNYNVGNGFNPGLNGFDGWGNGEWEWYRPQNCYQSSGNLVIRADYNTTPQNIVGRDWYQFSCRITSDTKFSVLYGAVEARMQLPTKWGTWPAFWMLGDACDETSTSSYSPAANYYDRMPSNWSSCGEIDIMEHRNTESIIHHNLFWDNRVGVFPWDCCTTQTNPTQVGGVDPTAFHTYRLEWTSTQLRWLIDGNVTKTQDITAANMEEFHKPYHLIMNLAISGAFTGYAQPNQWEFPLFLNVDYVRVYAAGQNPENPTGDNLARGKAAVASTICNNNETAAKAVNGSVSGGNSDKWCAPGSSNWMRVDLGANYNVSRFVVKHAGAGGESTNYNTRNFHIETSTDGTTWYPRVNVSGNTQSVTTHTIAASTARYVRLYVTQPEQGGGGAARIYEFEVYQ